MKAWVSSPGSPYGICGGHCGLGQVSVEVFALLALINCHFTNAPYSFICEVGLVQQAHQ